MKIVVTDLKVNIEMDRQALSKIQGGFRSDSGNVLGGGSFLYEGGFDRQMDPGYGFVSPTNPGLRGFRIV